MDPGRKGKKMKIGTKVQVKTKHYGTLTGVLLSYGRPTHGQPYWFIKPENHPRNIAAVKKDITVLR